MRERASERMEENVEKDRDRDRSFTHVVSRYSITSVRLLRKRALTHTSQRCARSARCFFLYHFSFKWPP